MNRETLRRDLEHKEPLNDRERNSLAATLDRLTWLEDPFDVAASDHHLTASSFVISSRGVILHRHRLLDIWIQPGGHVDGDETPEEACLRETYEETGLVARHVEPLRIFHVDEHPGPRGHTHYDLRYVLLAEPLDPTPGEGESKEVYWFDFDAAPLRAETSLVPVLARLAACAPTWA